MSESKIVLYIGRNALENIAIFDEDFPNLHDITKNHSILCLDLTEQELDEILDDVEGDLSQFCLKNNIKTVPLKEYFNAIKEDSSLIVDKPRAIFFLNISSDEAKMLSEKYGVIIQSESSIDDNILQLSFRKSLDKGDVVKGNSDGWSNLLSAQKLPPLNSLIITDNYLLQNELNGKLIGFENLKMVLNAVLPQKLDTVFHLLIVAPMPQKIRPEKADQLNGMLKAYLKTIRPYDFQLEFVFNYTIHARKILSNYFVIIGDKGFQLFHPSLNTTVYDDNEISVVSILHDTKSTSGDSVLAITYKDLAKIRKGCITLREQIIGGVKDPTKKIIGDTDKDKSIRNRLLS